MTEYFIVANSFAAPFFSDTSESFVEAKNPDEALLKFIQDYGHPAGLYSANVYANANDFHRSSKAKKEWET